MRQRLVNPQRDQAVHHLDVNPVNEERAAPQLLHRAPAGSNGETLPPDGERNHRREKAGPEREEGR